MNGSVLVQGAMRPRFVIILRVGLKDPAQVPLAQGDDMIDALGTDRSDQPLGETVLPRRARRKWACPDAVPTQSSERGKRFQDFWVSEVGVGTGSRCAPGW